MRVCVLRTLPYCPINNYRPEEDCGDQANLYWHCDEPSAWRTLAYIHQQSVPSRKEVAGLRGAKHNHYQWFSRINHQNKMLDKSVGMGGRGMAELSTDRRCEKCKVCTFWVPKVNESLPQPCSCAMPALEPQRYHRPVFRCVDSCASAKKRARVLCYTG